MKRIFYLIPLLVLIALAPSLRSQCVQNVNFNDWEDEGDTAASWSTLSAGTQAFQNSNTFRPSFFLGPDTLMNVHVSGKFRVNTNNDDDYIGFVFGYLAPTNFGWMGQGDYPFALWNTMVGDFYLFDWKKNGQTYSGYTALEGFTLDHVDGSFFGSFAGYFPGFWSHTNSASFNVMATSYSTTSGWVSFTTYDFDLYLSPTRAVILIDADTIFDHTDCYHPGRFGFYNMSQDNSLYWDFTYELFLDFQIEYENVCLGDTGVFNFIDTTGCGGFNSFTNLDTFYWDLGDGTITNDTNPRHVYQYADTFTVMLIATDINGCTDTSLKEIYIHPPATAHIALDDGCFADSVLLQDSTYLPMGGNVATWEWDMGDGTGTSTLENPLYLYSAPGNYTIELIIETNAGCRDTVEEEITIYALPDVDFTFQNACEGAPVVLNDLTQATAFPIASNGWDVDADSVTEYAGLNVQHTYNAYGVYPVELKSTDAFGCSDSITKNITVHPLPDADFFVPGVCFQDASQLIDSSSVPLGAIQSWNWNYGNGNQFNYSGNNPPLPGPTFLFDNPGAKTVALTVTTDSGCVDTKIKTIQVYYLPVANFFADTVCDDQNTSFTQASYNQSGNLSYFKWEFGDGDSAFTSNPQHNYPVPGTYAVTLTVGSNLGCEDTVHKDIHVYPTPHTAFGWLNNVCEGDPLPFTDQTSIPQVTPGGDQVVAWQWIFNGADTQMVQHPIYQTTKFENINVQLTTWSNQGCVSISENTALIFPLPRADFDVDPACALDSTSFTNTSKVFNGIIAATEWTFGNGGVSVEEHPKEVYQQPGTYTVTLLATSNKGCKDQVSGEITIPATPVSKFVMDPDLGCSPFTVNTLNQTTLSSGILSYEWYLNDSLVSNASNPRFKVYNDTLIPVYYTLKLIAYSDLGCSHETEKVDSITVLPAPVAAYDLTEVSYNMYNPRVEFVNQSRHAVQWLWSFGDGATSDDFAPVHTYSSSGSYPIYQVAINEFNCPDTAFGPISKIQGFYGADFQWYLVIDPITNVYIPNAFTPNGDGVNDVWSIKGFNEGKLFEIQVFNRWGELMSEGVDMNFSWDGRMPNSTKFAPNGTYVYSIRYKTSDDKERELSGTFNLLR